MCMHLYLTLVSTYLFDRLSFVLSESEAATMVLSDWVPAVTGCYQLSPGSRLNPLTDSDGGFDGGTCIDPASRERAYLTLT